MNEEDARTKPDLLFEVSSLNARLSNEIMKNEQLKSVIDEAREYMRENISRDVRYREDDNYICSDWIIKEPKKLLEILDKAKVGDKECQ